MKKPSPQDLSRLYVIERTSPEVIGRLFSVSGRTVRNWLDEAKIPRLGPAHLRKGKSATWNEGRKHTAEHRRKNSESKKGNSPPNKGAGDVTFNCEACGVSVTAKPYQKRRTCSAKCRDRLSTSLRGDKHWNFKGEASGSRQRARLWAESKAWRQAVISAASCTCAKCGDTRNIVAHHINSFSGFPEQRFDVANGAALCRTCHLLYHKTCGFRGATRDSYEQWLTS